MILLTKNRKDLKGQACDNDFTLTFEGGKEIKVQMQVFL